MKKKFSKHSDGIIRKAEQLKMDTSKTVRDAVVSRLLRISNLKRFALDNGLKYEYLNQIKNRKRAPGFDWMLNLCHLLDIDPATGEELRSKKIRTFIKKSISAPVFTDKGGEIQPVEGIVQKDVDVSEIPDEFEINENEYRLIVLLRSEDPYAVFDAITRQASDAKSRMPIRDEFAQSSIRRIEAEARSALELIRSRKRK